jgi:hypothetical protein
LILGGITGEGRFEIGIGMVNGRYFLVFEFGAGEGLQTNEAVQREAGRGTCENAFEPKSGIGVLTVH